MYFSSPFDSVDSVDDRQINHISIDDLLQFTEKSGNLLVDVRSHSRYLEGHISGALSFPIDFFYDNAPGVSANVLKNANSLAFYCDSNSCGDSYKAAKIASAWTKKRIYVYSGGWREWEKTMRRLVDDT